jgi:hypothetical protein
MFTKFTKGKATRCLLQSLARIQLIQAPFIKCFQGSLVLQRYLINVSRSTNSLAFITFVDIFHSIFMKSWVNNTLHAEF